MVTWDLTFNTPNDLHPKYRRDILMLVHYDLAIATKHIMPIFILLADVDHHWSSAFSRITDPEGKESTLRGKSSKAHRKTASYVD